MKPLSYKQGLPQGEGTDAYAFPPSALVNLILVIGKVTFPPEGSLSALKQLCETSPTRMWYLLT